jgi:hypothetical protein
LDLLAGVTNWKERGGCFASGGRVGGDDGGHDDHFAILSAREMEMMKNGDVLCF